MKIEKRLPVLVVAAALLAGVSVSARARQQSKGRRDRDRRKRYRRRRVRSARPRGWCVGHHRDDRTPDAVQAHCRDR